MEDKKIIIGVGVVALLGVGYYMMKKNKQTPLVNMPNKPLIYFDRDKASRDFAKFAFPILEKQRKDAPIKNYEMEQQAIAELKTAELKRQQLLKYNNASGVVSGLSREQVLANTLNDYRTHIASNQGVVSPKSLLTEFSIYKSMLATLNSITDDSDAEFTLNEYKKYVELGGDRGYKPDLDTQIRFESFTKKYPNLVTWGS